jgi:hypothetical protein
MHGKLVRATLSIASIHFAAGVAMSQSPTPNNPQPMTDTPVTLSSGTVVRVRNIVVFVGPSGKSLTLYIETPTQPAESAQIERDAKELIGRYGESASGPFVRAIVSVCRTQACLEMREPPSEMFSFIQQPDGSWRGAVPPDR